MPEELANWTLGDILAWATGLTILGALIWKIWGPLKAIKIFLEHWNGRPEQKDWSGKVIAKATPGVPAMLADFRTELHRLQTGLDEVISQVKNHHDTNLRDDVTKLQRTVEGVNSRVKSVSAELSEHVKISKEYDAAQERTAKVLDQHLQDTRSWHPILKAMYEGWVKEHPPKDDED